MLVAGRERTLLCLVHTVAVDPFPSHWHQVPVVAGSVALPLPPNIALHDIVSFFSAQCAPSCLIIRVAAGFPLRVDQSGSPCTVLALLALVPGFLVCFRLDAQLDTCSPSDSTH